MASLLSFAKSKLKQVGNDIGGAAHVAATGYHDVFGGGNAAPVPPTFVKGLPAPAKPGNAAANAVGGFVKGTANFVASGVKSPYDIARGAAASGDYPGGHLNPTALANAHKAKAKDFSNFGGALYRPAVQAAETVTHPFSQHTFTPTSNNQKEILGTAPIQNINAGVATTYKNHPNMNPATRVLLAGAYGGGQAFQDAAALGGAKEGIHGVGDVVTNNAPKAAHIAGKALTPTVPLNQAGAVGKDVAKAQASVKAAAFFADKPKATSDYQAHTMKEFGTSTPNVVSGDSAKFIIDGGTVMNPANSGAYHEPASAFAKDYYNKLLSDPATKDKPVLITAGGAGAGKTTSLKLLKEKGGSLDKYAAVNDTNLTTMKSATDRIEPALASGRKVRVAYTFRDPTDAFVNGNVKRAGTTGRIVPITAHVDTHLGSLDTIRQLADKYHGNPNVDIRVIDNSRGAKKATMLPASQAVDFLKNKSYNKDELTKGLQHELQQAKQNGTVTPEAYNAYREGLGTRTGGQLEPQRFPGNEAQAAPPVPQDLVPVGAVAQQRVADLQAGRGGEPPVIKSPDSVPVKGDKPSRFANVTVQNSEKVEPLTKQLVKEKNVNYTPAATKAGQDAAAARYGAGDVHGAALEVNRALDGQKPGHISRQDVFDAQEVAGRLQKSTDVADKATAADLYAKLSSHHTAAGQQIQAAAALAKQSPEGMLYSATKELQKHGVKVEGKLADKLNSRIDDFEKATDPGAKDTAYQKFVHDVNQAIPRNKAEAGVGIWRAGLLTGPETVSKVGVSHLITAPEELLGRGAGAMVDTALSKLTGKRTLTFKPGDLKDFAKGEVEGVKAAKTKLTTGLDAPGTGSFREDIGTNSHQTRYEQAVGRLHSALPKPNFKAAYNLELKNQGRLGVTGDTALEAANQYAEKFTNMNHTQLGEFANTIQKFKPGGLPVGKWLVPFARVPTAIAAKGIVDWTPLGIVKGGAKVIIDKIKGNEFDQRALSETIGRSTTGSATTVAVGYALSKADRLTLQAPNDNKDKALWAAEGKTRNSIYVGGKVTKDSNGVMHYNGGNWVTLNAFGPAGIAIGLGGAFHQATQKGQSTTQAVVSAAAGAGKLVVDQPYFKGISGASNALNNPAQYARSYEQSTVGSLIPAAVQQLARGSDTKQRLPTNIKEQVQSEIPGQRQKLAATLDLYGKPLAGNSNGALLPDVAGTINPFYPSGSRNGSDSVTSELQRLYNNGGSGKATPAISAPSKNFTINGQKVALKQQQLSDYIAGAGPLIHAGVQNLLKNPTYQSASDDGKVKQINDVITGAYDSQKITQLGDNPKTKTNATKAALQGSKSLGTNLSTSGLKLASGLDPASSAILNKVAALPADQKTAYLADPKNKLQYDNATFKNKVANGKLSSVQQFKGQQTLNKENTSSQFNPKVVQLYSLSKSGLQSYLAANPSDRALTTDVLKYGDSLAANGQVTKNKFRDKFGNASLAPAAAKGRKLKFSTTSFKTAKAISAPKQPKGVKVKKVAAAKGFTPKKLTVSKIPSNYLNRKLA